jgi:RHS repeat-associated protein
VSSVFLLEWKRLQKPLCLLATLLLWLFATAAARAEDKSGVSPDRVKLPKGPGSLEGIGENAQPNLSMGVLGYGLAIDLPKGYVGATPSLRLSYASSGGNGELGIGWSLSVPSIERRTVHGLPRYDTQDSFAANGGEELVRVDAESGVYCARFEGSFVRYRWHDPAHDGRGGYWTAEFPDGRIGYFGATSEGTPVAAARVSGEDGVFRYQLVELMDQLGHRVVYEYQQDGGHALLARISYVFNDRVPRYDVGLAYESRADVMSDAKPGFELRLSKRLASIQVRARGEQLRRYALTYESNTRLSRLARVEQYGLNDEGPFPAVFTFAYTGGFAAACTSGCQEPYVQTMQASLGLDFKAGTAELIDINGDTLPDVVDTAQATHRFFLNELGATVHGFMSEKASSYGSASMASAAVQLVDVNGDGFTDLLNGNTKTILFNRGGGDWDTSSQPSTFSFPNLDSDANAKFFDYDNDKRIDLLHADGAITWVYANRGDGRFEQVLGVDAIDGAFTAGLQLADLNGDGLQDVVRMTGGLIAYRMSLGWGRFAPWLEMGGAPQNLPIEPHFVDLDGDSLPDLVGVQGDAVLFALNEAGRGFGPMSSLAASSDLPIPERTSSISVRFADMNGSGSTDVVWIDASGKVRYLELFPERGNLLRRIENALGKVTEATYASAASHMALDGGPSMWKYRVPQPMLMLDRVDTWDEHSKVHHVQTFAYRNGYYDAVERQFRGYEDVIVETLGDASVEDGRVRYHYDVGAEDAYHHALLVEQVDESDGRVLSTSRNRYEDCDVASVPSTLNTVRYVCLKHLTTLLQEGAEPSEWVTVEEAYEYDGYGNRTRTAKLGVTQVGGTGCKACTRGEDVFGEPCGEVCRGDESYEESDFITPKSTDAPWLVRSAYRKRWFGREGGRTREEELHYDGPALEGLPLGELTHGLVTRVDTFSEDGEAGRVHKQRLEYDAHGAVITALDPNGHRRTYGYDEDSLLPEAETVHFDDVGHAPYRLEMRVAYHPISDLIERSNDWIRVDENGESESISTLYAYDGFGRLSAIAQPGDTLEKPTEAYEYVFTSPRSRIVRLGRSVSQGPMDLTEVQCFDGQGHKLQTRTRIAGDQFQVSGYASFNALGKEARSYQAHLGTGEACASIEPPDALFASSSYDAQGRTLEVEKPDAEIYGAPSLTRTQYAPLRSISWDEEDTDSSSAHYATPTTALVDGLGRSVRIDRELEPGQTILTNFRYDELGNLRGYVDAKGNEKIQTYDLMGRLREVRDPDAGKLRYVHDAVGNRLARTDARGESVLYSFDEADRPVAEWSASNPMASQIWRDYDRLESCDACTNVVGRLAQVTFPVDADSPRGRDQFGYDDRGRAVLLSRTLDDHRFQFDSEYDNLGRILASRSTLGIDFEYEYDSAGRLTSAPGYVDRLKYDARGSLESIEYANRVKTRYSYDANARLSALSTKSGATRQPLQAYSYVRDRAGNIVSLSDASELRPDFPRDRASYAYDAWYRLRSAILEPGREQQEELSYRYDEIDNILTKISTRESSVEHVGQYRYGEHAAGPHAVTKAGDIALTYDAAGNVLTHDGQLYGWDARGRLLSAHAGHEELGRYSYGPGFDRVKKVEAGKATYYVTPDFEIRDGVAIGYLTVAGHRVARVENTLYPAELLPDLAPAERWGETLRSHADGEINAADAWLAIAQREDMIELDQVPELDETTASSILSSSARRNATEFAKPASADLAVTFLHENHLGSLRLATDGRGEVLERAADYPYGADRDQATSALDYGYTGKETDAQTGLMYFGARYYMPRLGRWGSVDPAFLALEDHRLSAGSQAIGAYGFAAGSPTSNRDLDGMTADSTTDDGYVDEVVTGSRHWSKRIPEGPLPGYLPGTDPRSPLPTASVAHWGRVSSMAETMYTASTLCMPFGYGAKGVQLGMPSARAVQLALPAARGLPTLAGKTIPELASNAFQTVARSGGDQAAKATLFEKLIPQIQKAGDFVAPRALGTDGSLIYLGKFGEGLVINTAGQVYRGSVAAGSFVLEQGGKLTPVFDKLRLLQ